MRIIAHRFHVHHLRQREIGQPQLRHGHGNRSQTADLLLGRHRTFRVRVRRAFAAVIDQRQALAFRVLEVERQAAVALGDVADGDAGDFEPFMPPAQIRRAGDAHAAAGDGVVAALLARRRKIEKGDVAAGRGHAVGIKQVIGGNIILVDGLLDQAQAEQLGVKFDVAGRVGRHGGEMVDAGKLHCGPR